MLFLRLLWDGFCRDRFRFRLVLLRSGNIPRHLPKYLFAGGTLLQVLLHQFPAALGAAAVHIEGKQVLRLVGIAGEGQKKAVYPVIVDLAGRCKILAHTPSPPGPLFVGSTC